MLTKDEIEKVIFHFHNNFSYKTKNAMQIA